METDNGKCAKCKWYALQSSSFTSLDEVLFGCPAELWVSFLIKEKMGCDGWTLNRVTFCQWQQNCTSDEMGTPKGNNGKDCTWRRYRGTDRYSTWQQWPFVIGYEAHIQQSDGLDLEKCRGKKAWAWYKDLELYTSQTWALLECLTAACKAFSLANAKVKGTSGLLTRSLD